MSLPTWTRAALSSERRRMSGVCWRAVEAQHRVSTMKLVDTLAEQSLLETLVESTKPPLPPDCRHLHYLLATPCRPHAGRVLRVEERRHRDGGDDLPPPAVLRRFAADAVARRRRRLHGVL